MGGVHTIAPDRAEDWNFAVGLHILECTSWNAYLGMHILEDISWKAYSIGVNRTTYYIT